MRGCMGQHDWAAPQALHGQPESPSAPSLQRVCVSHLGGGWAGSHEKATPLQTSNPALLSTRQTPHAAPPTPTSAHSTLNPYPPTPSPSSPPQTPHCTQGPHKACPHLGGGWAGSRSWAAGASGHSPCPASTCHSAAGHPHPCPQTHTPAQHTQHTARSSSAPPSSRSGVTPSCQPCTL